MTERLLIGDDQSSVPRRPDLTHLGGGRKSRLHTPVFTGGPSTLPRQVEVAFGQGGIGSDELVGATKLAIAGVADQGGVRVRSEPLEGY